MGKSESPAGGGDVEKKEVNPTFLVFARTSDRSVSHVTFREVAGFGVRIFPDAVMVRAVSPRFD